MKWKIVTINEYNECVTRWVILFIIVLVIPVKYESVPRTSEFQFKKQRVQSSNCLDLSCIQTVNLKAESKTFYNIDTNEITGFSSHENLVSSEDTIFILHMWRYHGCHGYFDSVSANRKRASQHLAICVYIINRILHARLWIRILSSTREISSWTREDKIRIHVRAISAICNYYNLEKTRVNWRDLGSRSRQKARGKGEMQVENFPNLGKKPLKTVQNTSDRST